MGFKLIIDELGDGGCAEGTLHFLFGRFVLAVVHIEAGETGEVAAVTAGENAWVGMGVRR